MPEAPKQKTPQGETIPVPTRRQVFDDLMRVAKPLARPSDDVGSGSADDK